jgi:hypothetical protein
VLRVLRATQLAMAINWNVSTSQVACCHTLSTDPMYTGEDAGADHCLFLSRLPIVNTARGRHIPHSLALHDIRLTPTYGTLHNRLREHRKLSVLEFYLPSRLLHRTPQFILLTLGKTIQDLWERPKCHLHET